MFQNRNAAIKKLDGLLNQIDSRKGKRTTLADLGSDWIVNAVSLVEQPAVPMAKFLAIKSKGADRATKAQPPQSDRDVFGRKVDNRKAGAIKQEEGIAFEWNPIGSKVNSFINGLGEDDGKPAKDEKRDLHGCRIK